MKPLLYMRKKGLFGSFFGNHAGIKGLSKSVGNAVEFSMLRGEEIVTNGDFEDADTGWTGLDVVDGVARTLDTTGYQVISTVIGIVYEVTFLCDAKGVSPQLQIQNGAITGSPVIAEVNPSGNGTMKPYSTTFTALGLDSIIILSNGSNTALWDNISIREIL